MSRVNDHLNNKADATMMRAAQEETLDEASRQMACLQRDMERAVDACAHQCESQVASTSSEVSGLRHELAQHRDETAEAAANAPTAKQVRHPNLKCQAIPVCLSGLPAGVSSSDSRLYEYR
jgi:hypothetical protein